MAESTALDIKVQRPNGAIFLYIDWVASATGTHTNYVLNTASATTMAELKDGFYLYEAITVPSGATAPAANYDITVIDSESRDLLQGNLANRSATVTEYSRPNTCPSAVVDNLTVTFANLGNDGIGQLILCFARY